MPEGTISGAGSGAAAGAAIGTAFGGPAGTVVGAREEKRRGVLNLKSLRKRRINLLLGLNCQFRIYLTLIIEQHNKLD
jgi:hypothetical protein